MTRLTGYVPKAWGHEYIWATNDQYCGKIMQFRAGTKFSMHFHAAKDETWYVLDGRFQVRYIDTTNAEIHAKDLSPGDVWRNLPLHPHQLICLEAGSIIEVSTADSVEDNYRVMPGDSQQETNK